LILRFLIIALLALVAAVAARAETLSVNGEQREYFVDGIEQAPKPLIIALHGGGGSAKRFRKRNGLREEALENGFVIVWPDSDGGNWNDGRRDPKGRLVSEAEDEAFILQLVEDLVARKIADPSRVYVTGHSNGGMMSFALGCTHPKIFKAIAPVSANVPRPMDCAGRSPVRVLNIIGAEDRVVPFEGGGIFGRLRRGALFSVPDGFDLLAERNRCEGTVKAETPAAMTFKGKSCAADTVQIRLKEQGHSWPDGAAQRIISFFKAS
jgi:polyhydroxybutyrate depolymerase